MNTYLDRVKRSRTLNHTKNLHKKWGWKNILLFIVSIGIIGLGIIFIWLSTLKIPDLSSFSARQTQQSTQIYDRTGTVLLYDAYQGEKRTVVSFDQISPYIKDATLSIEDKDFYHHGGIVISSILRSILVDLTSLSLSQGGSTITQQVVKNDILTNDKTPTRKLKEWILSEKLEKIMTKDQIFNLYLNDIPYGGSNYGVEEAAESYFGIHAADVDIAQAAYLAAMPQAPSYYSPYGPNKDQLDLRKNLVLKEMLNNGYITAAQYASSTAEVVSFSPQQDTGIKAPHFVTFVENYLEQKYGDDVLQTGGLKVITTLDYGIEQKAEAVALKYATSNEKNFNGSNDAFVALDPKTGQILAMVGSRNFFDTQIDGQFNVATAHRQPGSAFKPFVYAQAFNEGYTPNTVLFDTPTQFSTTCAVNNFTDVNGCYAPVDYDGKYRGPMTLRDALAQSINVPSVETLYLAGIQNSIDLAESMGITSLGNPDQYGLTLVLGGGEVSLLDMTSAYGVFANDGTRNPYTAILEVDDSNGNVLEKYTPNPSQVLNPQSAEEISDILSDDVARTPLYGAHSALYFPGYDVAVKTGTTNDSRDAWSMGYTPDLVLGAWAGNNDDTPMTPNSLSGLIVVPMWSALMNQIIGAYPPDQFVKPQEDDSYALKPVLRGEWQGGISTLTSNGVPLPTPLASSTLDSVPYNSIQETLSGGVHSILYWLNKDDPRGPETPGAASTDPQFKYWEYSATQWAQAHGYQ
jgi:1A family penicillin-binding protein